MDSYATSALTRGATDASSLTTPIIDGGTPGQRANTMLARWPKWQRADAARRLRWVLITGDAFAMFIGFAVPLLAFAEVRPESFWYGLACAAVVAAVGVYAMRFQGLWLDRVTSVRAIEVSKIARALVMLGVVVLVLDRKSSVSLRAPGVIAAAMVAWVVIVMWRSAYRAVLAAERRHGRLLTRVILIGTDRRATDLYRLLEVHSELGMRVIAVIGNRHEAEAAGVGHLWRSGYIDAGIVVGGIEAESVIMCSSDIDPVLAASLTRNEHTRRRSVYVDPGLPGFDIRRFQATHIAHQPLLEVESNSLAVLQHAVKRTFDIFVAALVALLAAPVLLAVSLLIKLEDGGPVLFRQKRVGRHGEVFEIFKFRTMVTDAEARLAALMVGNERTGPLFKMEHDPRITRIGRFLRSTSLDELPQVFNVLMGTMSLVGPRPALPDEVETFDEVLKTRHQVRPGITGLWQVEARDNPSFDAYRRLDLFYVENWSMALDMVILLATVDHILFRPLVKWRYKTSAPVPASPLAPAVADLPAPSLLAPVGPSVLQTVESAVLNTVDTVLLSVEVNPAVSGAA